MQSLVESSVLVNPDSILQTGEDVACRCGGNDDGLWFPLVASAFGYTWVAVFAYILA